MLGIKQHTKYDIFTIKFLLCSRALSLISLGVCTQYNENQNDAYAPFYAFNLSTKHKLSHS